MKKTLRKLGSNDLATRLEAVSELAQLTARALEALAGALADPDDTVRRHALKALNSLGWTPVNDTQCAWIALTEGRLDFQSLERQGESVIAASVNPLVTIARKNKYHAEEALRLLEQVLDCVPRRISVDNLREVTVMNIVKEVERAIPGMGWGWTLNNLSIVPAHSSSHGRS